MLRVKRSHDLTSRSTFRTGVIVKTRAAFVGGSTSDPNASGAWAVVCLARFEDGDEHELTLAEAVACAVDDPTHKVTHTSSLEADEDAETEPVGSAFVRDAVAETTDIANKRREGNVLNVSRTKPATSARSTRSRGAKRAREAEETTSARSLPRRNGRPPLGALSSNEAFRRSEGQVPKPKEPTGTFPERRNVKRPTRAAPVRRASARGAGAKRRNGRFAPWRRWV